MESKFCTHCGAAVNSNSSLFCGQCGKQVGKPGQDVTKAKVSRNKKPLIIGGATAVILAVILGVVVFSHPKYAVIGKWIDQDEDEWEFSRNGYVFIIGSYSEDIGSYSFDDRKYITIKGIDSLCPYSSDMARFEIKLQGDEMVLENLDDRGGYYSFNLSKKK